MKVATEPRSLEAVIAREVGHGGRVESRTNTQAVIVYGRRPNHILHLILSVLTVGVWAVFVWLPLTLRGGERRSVYTAGPDGVVTIKHHGRRLSGLPWKQRFPIAVVLFIALVLVLHLY